MTKRDYCINELVETEKNYIEALAMIINVRHSLTLPYFILSSGWAGCFICPAPRPYQFGPMHIRKFEAVDGYEGVNKQL